ncbi:hypothetical protein FHS89_002716 [Rubricella aquisinus]|uniref:Surface lipoprotein assembly modifier N-terminal TPR repeats region domain-containing protein n=1 Tax=Rubricella aquisinus TaxID=2028108 RepID=A0A840X4E5_9RHOB|nr:tetratricopeptide repeat protein [Rubricella aquisinus]MBB5516676.1 hypothetical protein [Rubricella aquisinus]
MFRSLCVVLGVLLCPLSLMAEEGTTPYTDLTQSQQLSVIHTLIEQGRPYDAQTLLSASRFSEGELGFQAAFLQARLFRGEGFRAEAIALLRQILAERPDFARVRLELAEVLAEDGQVEAARHHLSLLAQSATTMTDRQRFEQFIAAISPEAPLQLRGAITLAPSTNINSGTRAETITVFGQPFAINQSNRQTSGMGLRINASGTYTLPVDAAAQPYVALSLTHTDYEQAAFDQFVGDLRFGVQIGPQERRWRIEALGDRRLQAGRPLDTAFGGRITHRRSLGPRWSGDFELGSVRRASLTDPLATTRTNGVEARFTRSLGAGRGLSFGAEVDRVRAYDRPQAGNTGRALSIGAFTPLGTLTLGAQIKAGTRAHDGLFPGVGEVRWDRYTEASLNMQDSRLSLFGLSPRLTLIRTVQDSNVAFYQFSRFGADLTLTRAF